MTSQLPATITSSSDLEAHYQAYLATLNARTFDVTSDRFLSTLTVVHNDRPMTHAQYCDQILPGAVFTAQDVVADVGKRTVAARLYITFPHPDTGAPHAVDELVLYRFDPEWKICRVWSMVEDAHFEREAGRG